MPDTRILYIEDNEIDFESVRRLFKNMVLPYVLLNSRTVDGAVKELQSGQVDLVLIDFSLPDGSGTDIQEHAGGTPCIFLTAVTDQGVAVRAMRDGTYDFLVKDSRLEYLKVLPIVIQSALNRKHTEEKLKEYAERYSKLVEFSPDLIALHDEEKLLYINPAGLNKLGVLSSDDLIGTSLIDRVRTDQREMFAGNIRRLIGREDPVFAAVVEISVVRPDGMIVDFEIVISPVSLAGKTVLQIVGRDISKRKKLEGLLRKLSFSDELTGVPNRRRFFEHLTLCWGQQTRSEQPLSLIMIDIDHFKNYNNDYGHQAGDEC